MYGAEFGRKYHLSSLILMSANSYGRNTKKGRPKQRSSQEGKSGLLSGWLLNGSKGLWPGAKQSVVVHTCDASAWEAEAQSSQEKLERAQLVNGSPLPWEPGAEQEGKGDQVEKKWKLGRWEMAQSIEDLTSKHE